MEFPVLYFNVTVTDATGIPTDLTDTYNATSKDTQHLSIVTDPTPNVCLPLRISVSATNDIGSTTHEMETLPGGLGKYGQACNIYCNVALFDIIIGIEDGCQCYLKRGTAVTTST